MLFDDGLDTVRLVAEVEDVFGISIPDKEAERIQTAGQLCDYLVKKIGAIGSPSDSCLSAASFYLTRRKLASLFGVKQRAIGPDTAIEQFIPMEGRRAAWEELEEKLAIELPPLEFPQSWGIVPFCLCGVGLIAAMVAGAALGRGLLVAFAPTTFIASLWIIGTAELFFGFRVPRQCKTVGALSSLLMPDVLESRKPNQATWSQQEIWQLVQHLTAFCAGVSPKEVSRDSHFLGDFI